MEQSERIAELDRFKSEEINILVASDVAARGLDVKGVSHVFNYDVPWQPDDYIHRIGRTGRAGKTGTAITLAGRDDADQVAAIERLMGFPIPQLSARGSAEEAAEAEQTEKPAAAQKAEAPAEKSEKAPRRGRKAAKPREEKAEVPREREREQAAPTRNPERDLEPVEEGWNGPVPSFLGQGFGS
jgi:superfamily II DNA/RNA helicase